MYIYRFSEENQERLQTPMTTTPTMPDTTVQPLGRHIAKKHRAYLYLVGHLVADSDVERVNALDHELEADDLPQRARLAVQLHGEAERRVIGRNGEPLLGAAQQGVAR